MKRQSTIVDKRMIIGVGLRPRSVFLLKVLCLIFLVSIWMASLAS